MVGFDWLKRELLISIKKEPGTRTASRLSLVERVVGFDWLKRELLISIKKEPGTRIASRLSLVVPLTGLEPVRILLRGILSPLCLPIPPQRQVDGFT